MPDLPRVATKYPRIAGDHFASKGVVAEIIPVHGSVELAPLVGLSHLIVDLVETGSTLRENRLEVLETVTEVSTCSSRTARPTSCGATPSARWSSACGPRRPARGGDRRGGARRRSLIEDSRRPETQREEAQLLPHLAALPADIDTWVGGGTSVVAGVHRDPPATLRFDALAQAEVGLRLASGSLYFRLDLDVQATTAPLGLPAFGLPAFVYPTWSLPTPGIKIGPPEWAMLQIGREDHHLRLGIITHPIGIEDWDGWINTFPTTSTMISTVPGRMLGVEPGLVLGEGYEINLFGGFDLDVDAPTFGAGLTTMQPLWSTWSGIALLSVDRFLLGGRRPGALPGRGADRVARRQRRAGGRGQRGGAIELKPWVGGEIIANVLPKVAIHPSFRIQALHEPGSAPLCLSVRASAERLRERRAHPHAVR